MLHRFGRHRGAHHLVRGAAVLTAAVVTLSTLGAPAEATAPDRADTSATWLSRQLTDGVVHNRQYDFDDLGLTIDVAFGLDAMGGHRATVREIGTALKDNVGSYISGDGAGDPGSTYAGATAKTLVLAQIVGRNPRSFGGVDLVSRLESVVETKAPIRGRIFDVSGFGDFANTIGQAYAARGLAEAGSPKAKPALDFLLQQQCAKGFFRLNLNPDREAADQTCDGAAKGDKAPDTDATAIALISLAALDSKRPVVREAIADGVGWLKRRQAANGSFGGGPSTEAPNANSTGIAAWALAENGACPQAVDAASWVRELQVFSPAKGSKLAKEAGAIAYDRAALKAGRADGITVAARDQWRRTTAQAAPAMDLLTIAACKKF